MFHFQFNCELALFFFRRKNPGKQFHSPGFLQSFAIFNFYYCPGADTVPEVKEDDVLPVPDGPADEVVPEPGVVDVRPG